MYSFDDDQAEALRRLHLWLKSRGVGVAKVISYYEETEQFLPVTYIVYINVEGSMFSYRHFGPVESILQD